MITETYVFRAAPVITICAALFAALFLPLESSAADSSQDKSKSEEAERDQRVALSKYFQVPESHLEQIRSKPMSWDEIFKALAVAQQISRNAQTPLTTDEALNKVLDLRSQNLSWGKIAVQFGFKFSYAVQVARKEMKDAAP